MVMVLSRNELCVLAMLLVSAICSAQSIEGIDVNALTQKYKNEKSVIIDYRRKLEITNGSGGLDIQSEYVKRVLHVNVKGSTIFSDEVPYDPHFNTINNLQAFAHVFENGKYRKVKVTEFEDTQSMDSQSFYDSQRTIKFEYPSIQSGSITEKFYYSNIIDPYALGGFSFDFHVPAELVTYEVIAPDDVELGISNFGPLDLIEYTQEHKGKKIIHKWTAKSVASRKDVDFSMNDTYYRPHIFVYIKSYVKKGKKIEIQGTPDLLYKYNYGFIKDLNKAGDEGLKMIVDSIKTHNKSEEDVVKSIFYWVQNNVRYIAFEYGSGGFIPRHADDVFEKKFGDCKDMANLIKTMMDYAGIPGYLCWIGTRHLGYTYDALPLPYCDNHMIAAYKKGDEYIYLDGTGKYDTFGYPSWGIQGKQAMISIDENNYEIRQVPVFPADKSAVTDNISVGLDGKNLIFNGTVELTGFLRSGITGRIESVGAQNEASEWLDILERGNNKCKLISFSVQNFHNRDSSLVVEYELVIQDYVKEIGNDLYINFNFDKGLTSMRPDTTDRECGADYSHAFVDRSVYSMAIPDGYLIKSIPDNLYIVRDDYEISFNYSVKDNQIIVEKLFSLNTILIEKDDLKQWINDLNKINEAYQKTVYLSKIK